MSATQHATLLDEVIEAAGGRDQWLQHSFVSAHLVQSGGIWAMKGQPGVLDDVRIDVALHQEWVSHHPFGSPDLRSSFTPRRVEMRFGIHEIAEFVDDPRPALVAAPQAAWTGLQLAYFVGTAMWTYLTQPFCFKLPGFRVEEIDPWTADATTLRRLQVHWPSYLATHCTRQILYVDDLGRFARHDYEVEILGNAPAAHLFDEYATVGGITMPTQHRIYGRGPDGEVDTSAAIVTIDIDDIGFGQV
jgi:hypothetical protein